MKLHLVVLDNYATHKHPTVQAWLARNPRITMHFTPTSGSWLNMVEIFFGIITRQAIRRGTFTSVKDLIAAIETFIDGWNERCHPFTWTKTAGAYAAARSTAATISTTTASTVRVRNTVPMMPSTLPAMAMPRLLNSRGSRSISATTLLP